MLRLKHLWLYCYLTTPKQSIDCLSSFVKIIHHREAITFSPSCFTCIFSKAFHEFPCLKLQHTCPTPGTLSLFFFIRHVKIETIYDKPTQLTVYINMTFSLPLSSSTQLSRPKVVMAFEFFLVFSRKFLPK